MSNVNNTISLEVMTSGWVRVESGSVRATMFLQSNQKHMDVVSFGDRGPMGSLAIKSDRLARFVEYARKSGLNPVMVGA